MKKCRHNIQSQWKDRKYEERRKKICRKKTQ